MKDLIVGSEGTLGIVTKAVLGFCRCKGNQPFNTIPTLEHAIVQYLLLSSQDNPDSYWVHAEGDNFGRGGIPGQEVPDNQSVHTFFLSLTETLLKRFRKASIK